MKISISGCELVCSGGIIITGNIGIENGRIVSVGEEKDDWQPDYVIEGKGKLAIPGLVNAHTHAAMTLFRSYADDMALMDWLETKIWPAEANLTGPDVYWGTMLAAAEMIRSGTTTFADMYFFMEDVAKAVSDSGIRGVLSRGMAGVAPTAEQALAESESFFREYHNTADGRIRVMLGPHAPYTCPPGYLKRVVALAQRLGAEIHIHLSETKGEVENCLKEHGKTPIALMNELGVLDCGVLAAHCVHVTDEDIRLMKEKHTRVVHNPGSNMKLASGIAPVPKMQAAGVCVALGTDGAASNNNLDMLEELRLSAMLHKVNLYDPLVVSALDAFHMATENGAIALGLGQEIGCLKEGYKADIVLLDMEKPHWYPKHDRVSLFTYAASAGDVDTVLVDGKIVMEKRVLKTIDEERLLYEVQDRGMRLVR